MTGLPLHILSTIDRDKHSHLVSCPVGLAGYQRRGRSVNDGPNSEALGVYLPRWPIIIYAVPRHVLHAIKIALVRDGLAKFVRRWIDDNAAITGMTGQRGFNLEYDVPEGRFIQIIRDLILPDGS